MNFMLGCNYWASNAGTEMWMQWDENAIEQDLKQLSAHGLKYLRVFPNWRDFQPVCAFYGAHNRKREYRHRDGSFFDNPYYIDRKMLERFECFCEIAAKYDMKLIVGLLTGWMSGRTFTPPILEGRDLYTDETALMLEQRFIKGFVSHFYENKAIYAWDLGNECNCFSEAANREVATAWIGMITNAIKANDKWGRQVVSGMHSLQIDGTWDIFDHGEETDILTTHPYPHFVPYCDKDYMVSYRTLLHATCEGMYYSDLGGKPCLTEEIGTLGPMTCDDETGTGFLKTNLYSNWANGSLGLFWWCGCEQVALTTAPYSWVMMERELGLMDLNRKPRKTLLAYKAFADWLNGFGQELPRAATDAVCILTKGQSQWGVAYMTYALAKQAHVNLKFTYSEQGALPDSNIYLMPSIKGTEVCCKETFDCLLEKVYKGATLYISNDAGYLAEFERFSGVHVVDTAKVTENCTMKFVGDYEVASQEITTAAEYTATSGDLGKEQEIEAIAFTRQKRRLVETRGAEVIAYDNLGIPAFTKYVFGKGCVYYVNFPLEAMLLEESFAFNSNYHMIYDYIFAKTQKQHPVSVGNKFVGMTCHHTRECSYVVLINYSKENQEIGLLVNEGHKVEAVYGAGNMGEWSVEIPQILPPHEAVVLKVQKTMV